MAARVYFVTGKGGTGKTTLANALTRYLSEKKQLRTLLLKMNSFSLSQGQYEPAKKVAEKLWEQNMHPHRVVEEYFSVTMAKLPMPSFFQKVAAKLNEEVASRLLSNKYVLKFIEACPGLIPTIFLGKICHEARVGRSEPQNSASGWDVVVVDAPSTGQALQVFESSRTLSRVLSQGIIHRHITDTLNYAYSKNFEIFIMTLPEEGPVQECLETVERFRKMDLTPTRVWMNKVSPHVEREKLSAFVAQGTSDEELKRLLSVELARIDDQAQRIAAVERGLGGIEITRICEKASDAPFVDFAEIPL